MLWLDQCVELERGPSRGYRELVVTACFTTSATVAQSPINISGNAVPTNPVKADPTRSHWASSSGARSPDGRGHSPITGTTAIMLKVIMASLRCDKRDRWSRRPRGGSRSNGVYVYAKGVPTEHLEEQQILCRRIIHASGADTILDAELSTCSIRPLASNTLAGTAVATIAATSRNGAPFTGTPSFRLPNSNGGTTFAMSGTQLIVNPRDLARPSMAVLPRTSPLPPHSEAWRHVSLYLYCLRRGYARNSNQIARCEHVSQSNDCGHSIAGNNRRKPLE